MSLYRGEKHAQKNTNVKDGNVPQSSNFVMLETDLDNVFSALDLPTYKPVCRSFIQVCNQIQTFNFRCQSVTITH